jgi:hypothetical protein
MKSPVAWIPSVLAARRLRELARSLNVFSEGKPLVQTLTGTRLITASSLPINNFPLKFDKQTRTLTLPGLYLDFVRWQYIPPQNVSGAPAANQSGYLRIVVGATYDLADFWATINIGTPTLEWVLDENVTAPPPDFYYFNIVRFEENAEPVPYQLSSPLIKRWPF